MLRAFLSGCALVAMAACQPAIPDSAAGVGFDNQNLSPRPVRNNRTVTSAIPPADAVSEEALLAPAPVRTARVATQPPVASPAPVTSPAPQPRVRTAPAPVATGEDTPRVRQAGAPQTTEDGIVHASPSNPAPTVVTNAGISDENDFEAVGARRSIEDDAQRLQANRQNYQVIAPTALPERTETAPNVVQYALSTRHPVGTKLFRRLGLNTKARYEKACAAFPSSGEAQAAFLAKGGPKRDRLGVDPDGDGYACDWNPEIYRKAARGG